MPIPMMRGGSLKCMFVLGRPAYRGQVPDSYLEGLSVEKRELMWTEILKDQMGGVLVAEDGGGNRWVFELWSCPR